VSLLCTTEIVDVLEPAVLFLIRYLERRMTQFPCGGDGDSIHALEHADTGSGLISYPSLVSRSMFHLTIHVLGDPELYSHSS
jgi:hypothetical protein